MFDLSCWRVTYSVASLIVLWGVTLSAGELEARSNNAPDMLEQIRLATVATVTHSDGGIAGGGCGVIVTPNGHVVIRQRYTPNRQQLRSGDKLQFHLSDDRTVQGRALGWSDEWGIALAQISGKGPWPHVDICPNDEIQVGVACAALGHFQVIGPIEQEQHFLMSFGKVRRLAPGRWLTSSCPMQFHGGVFDHQSRLLGMTTVITLGDDERIQTHVAIIKKLWDDLVAGKNVDKLRAFSLTNASCGESLAVSQESNGAAEHTSRTCREIAKQTTVRIQPARGQDNWSGWSGVVVTPEGHIATCGHHDRMPGERVWIHFSDGRKARGMVLGTNRVTDIGVVKIIDDGDWPFAELGLSQNISPGDSCVFAGFPKSHKGVKPMVRKGNIAEPDAYEWCSTILASGFEFKGGDSGGGLFDKNGVLVATLIGGTEPHKFTRHARSEFFHLQWDDLTSCLPVDVAPE